MCENILQNLPQRKSEVTQVQGPHHAPSSLRGDVVLEHATHAQMASDLGGVVVVGSSNVDLVCYTPRMPKPGETLTGSEFEQLFGGKGANQAVAAALLGSSVRMVSKLGADSLGEVRASLTRLEVSLALLSC